ncbi:ATP-dependent helicase [Roseateles sp. DAIF2]|uniref:UvrD-helicase domain-containing protein n=1 Tax=Roseateles sp. DAIF2 TaxID=2714952 RepID=UPI0018A2ED33|nr:ATP-dependent helicase [Roseateles sp. DAIF2]QPF72195.1 ATP-dependent helicase [Roseateles sp. DAIF2]
MSEPQIFQPAGLVPTPEQRAIQLARLRHLLVEANAGAAKTTTLALRIAQALQRGCPPERVLALTYTRPAVQALRERLAEIGLPASLLRRLAISTFDEFCAALLRGLEGGEPAFLSTPEQLGPWVQRALARAQSLPQEPYPEELAHAGVGELLVEGLLKSFALLKGGMALDRRDEEQGRLTPALAEELGFDYLSLRVWSAYEALRRGGNPDRPVFRAEGDATYDLARALAGEAADLYQPALQRELALLVLDEMHDTNRAMFDVLAALLRANPQAAFVGVGDRDQVIHGSAGAEAAFMGETFLREIGPAERLPLSATHRFGSALSQAVGRLAHKPYASSASARDTALTLLACEGPADMSRQVLEQVRAHLGAGQGGELRILLRHPAQSVLIEDRLLKAGVDYATEGFAAYLQRPEILLVRGLHAHGREDFEGFETPAARAALLRALLQFAGVPPAADEDEARVAEQGLAEAASSPAYLREFIEGQVLRRAASGARALLQAAAALLREDDMARFIAGFEAALDPRRLAGRVLVRRQDAEQVAAGIQQLLLLAAQEGGELQAFFRVLHSQANRLLRSGAGSRPKSGGRVVLSSIEAAKGLEFEHVLLPGLSRGVFAGTGSAHENRNLLYVAMTRARGRLTLLYDRRAPSRYLIDAGLLPPVS